jgi:hypothetical protein
MTASPHTTRRQARRARVETHEYARGPDWSRGSPVTSGETRRPTVNSGEAGI